MLPRVKVFALCHHIRARSDRHPDLEKHPAAGRPCARPALSALFGRDGWKSRAFSANWVAPPHPLADGSMPLRRRGQPRRQSATFLAALLAALALAPLAPAPALAQQTATQQPADADALFQQGLRFHDGDGVVQNFANAAALFTRAAEMGQPAAQNYLGRYYHSGWGVEKDQAKALHWLTLAARTGEAQYLHDLAQALETGADGSTDPEAAAPYYQQAADKGDLDSMVSLAVLYQNGTGVPQDFARARDLYAAAADKGHPRAMNNLGLLYVRGDGVPQDYDRAAALFAAAAETGMPQALTNLGVMYENGFGVPVDEARAAELYRQGGQTGRSDGSDTSLPLVVYDPRLVPLPLDDKALPDNLAAMAQAGDPVAMYQLGWLLAQSDAAPHDALTQAAALFRASAQRGYGPAMVNLGLLHFTGRGVLQDFVTGQMWLTVAEAAGQKGATDLGLSYRDVMTPAQINEAQARAAAALKR